MSMAAVVSHAMRRLPPSPQDNVYSSYGLRGEGSSKNWPSNSEEGESALSRSMRYADPWLYGSVRTAPTGLLLAPAFVLCTCSDYVNGTKRSSKKSPSTCKKCKGTRLPLSPLDKYGTVRCYPTSATVTPLRAGTVRVSSSSSRPSILPTADPYDLMRRSRLSVSESTSHFRTRSTSPNKSRSSEGRSYSATRKKAGVPEAYNSTFGRRSILECDINPYELMSSEGDTKDSSITFVNGQRIRVKPHSSSELDYEDVQVNKKQTITKPKLKNCNISVTKTNENESDYSNNRFKSILKKRTTFNDTDMNGPERTPSPALKTGSQFYIPMPSCNNLPIRKKVQFLVENELVYKQQTDTSSSSDTSNEDNTEMQKTQQNSAVDDDEEEKKTCKLRRSVSERFNQEQRKVVFNDTMALRTRISRGDSREAFTDKDLERLDGIRTRKISPNKARPNVPPPPPPPSSSSQCKTNCIEKANETNNNVPSSASVPDSAEIITTDEPIANSQEIITNKSNNKTELLSTSMIEKGEELMVDNGTPPSAPPRKRSNNKQPQINIVNNNEAQSVRIESPSFVEQSSKNNNKTVVQINGSPAVHKLKIKNEFSDVVNVQNVSVLENPQRKTSILINGDDCYSTVNVNDDIPLYQSSVVVKDSGIEITTTTATTQTQNKNSSSVYITGTFTVPEQEVQSSAPFNNESPENRIELKMPEVENKFKVTKDAHDCSLIENFNETNIPSSDRLKELLRDPVEAVRRNLVPHVCGKSDVSRRHNNAQDFKASNFPTNDILDTSLLDAANNSKQFIEESFLRLRNYESVSDDVCSEHSSSTQYELMDPGSDCYTDHSNRSSVTEEELANRTKFYELLADSAIEVFDSDDHHYESIRVNTDPIYEEIEVPPPLPANPPPASLLDDLQLDKEYTTRSIFEGASKYDILSYLVDAKERGIVQEDSYTFNNVTDDETKESFNRASHMSSVSDSSEDNSLIISGAIIDDKATCQKQAEVERNDSGVGSETSKSSLSKYRMKQDQAITCEDCESVIESKADSEPLICRKCVKKRSERKEIITEIVETEEKYSRDLQIILEEFYQPMLVAGLLTPDQLSAIFLNVEELLENSQALAERLRDAVEIALEQGDDDLLTVNIGKLFLEAAPMLHAFETYCVRQGAASLLLASLEKEKELLRIFLKVSQMENTMLRRMNLNSFLMVPVQRVTKYPLLLARLYKVTPQHHETREQLKEAQHKIELHLNHMNSETKDVPSKLWRRIGSNSGRRSSTEMDLVNIKLRKIAVDVLEWNHDEAKFALEGKLLFTQPTDNNWRKGRTIKLTPVNALLVINGKQSNNKLDKTDENGLIFSRHSGVREAALLLVRDKNGRYSLLRDPLYLDRCVIAADPAWQSYFEVQELLGKDTFIFKAEDDEQTHTWYKQLQYHAQGMGAWRKRRNALANIMINGMGLRS